jgi:hypothetical protein
MNNLKSNQDKPSTQAHLDAQPPTGQSRKSSNDRQATQNGATWKTTTIGPKSSPEHKDDALHKKQRKQT